MVLKAIVKFVTCSIWEPAVAAVPPEARAIISDEVAELAGRLAVAA